MLMFTFMLMPIAHIFITLPKEGFQLTNSIPHYLIVCLRMRSIATFLLFLSTASTCSSTIFATTTIATTTIIIIIIIIHFLFPFLIFILICPLPLQFMKCCQMRHENFTRDRLTRAALPTDKNGLILIITITVIIITIIIVNFIALLLLRLYFLHCQRGQFIQMRRKRHTRTIHCHCMFLPCTCTCIIM